MSKDEKDPIACSLFYITLKKKNVLLGLWKLSSNHNEQGAMVKFLGILFSLNVCEGNSKKKSTFLENKTANDFTEDRWQKAAVKNAFALLGKQRYGIKHFCIVL